jgi:hypothetical protein
MGLLQGPQQIGWQGLVLLPGGPGEQELQFLAVDRKQHAWIDGRSLSQSAVPMPLAKLEKVLAPPAVAQGT